MRALLACVAAVVGVAVAGCSTADGSSGDTDGPLSATLMSGGNAVYAPDVVPWRVSFGHVVLCTTDWDADIVVRDLDHDATVPPRDVKVYVRHVDPGVVPRRSMASEHQPFYSLKGSPPRFDEAYSDTARPPVGTFSEWIGDLRVSQPCTRSRERVHGYTELVFVLEVGRRGAQVDGFTLDCVADGEQHRLRVPWTMIGCGDAITEPYDCSP